MSLEWVLRISVLLLGALLGWQVGAALKGALITPYVRYYPAIAAVALAILGAVFALDLTIRPLNAARSRIRQIPARYLVTGLVGLVVGLIISALLALPLSLLPGFLGEVLPFVCAVVFSVLGITTMVMREKDIISMVRRLTSREGAVGQDEIILVDTSVIIDGRIADISSTGFISGTLVVPRFVLNELQHIADSPDVLRRNRGRRGLEILGRLQKDPETRIEISEMDIDGVREVDSKLVRLARELGCAIMTNDYNLNSVAKLQGVKVLNVNELANAVKVVVLPGEPLTVRIIQEGKEAGQGVGYLDDGTMVVVEDGRRYIDQDVEVLVTRVLQTVAGRMIFAQLESKGGH
ncbi:MAG: PIN/TRAM domain-containing protein [Anaerolineae bacterium]